MKHDYYSDSFDDLISSTGFGLWIIGPKEEAAYSGIFLLVSLHIHHVANTYNPFHATISEHLNAKAEHSLELEAASNLGIGKAKRDYFDEIEGVKIKRWLYFSVFLSFKTDVATTTIRV